jgi:hypothetical protein
MRFEELWLLEAVVAAHPPWEGWIPFRNLPNNDPNDLGQFHPNGYGNHADINFHSHHMSDEQLLDELGQLFAAGEIIGAILGSRWRPPEHLFVPSLAEIHDAFCRDNYSWLSYTLTPRGFARWEAFARPNWELFRKGGDGYEGYCCTEAPNKQMVEYWLSEGTPDVRLDWLHATFEELSPWQVFPCKTLPRGVSCSCMRTRRGMCAVWRIGPAK